MADQECACSGAQASECTGESGAVPVASSPARRPSATTVRPYRCGQTPWVVGQIASPSGPIPRVSTKLTLADRLGAWRVRWNIRRMDYRVPPGLYAVGGPGADSPVLVTANYKLTFDSLRRELSSIAAWILVLDTRGVNVWCAAGKKTFSTDELIRRVTDGGLDRIVSHRRLVLPQLGAPGVAAHLVH